MDALTIEQFDHFFEQVTGHAPFLWQRRLAREVAESGWPDVLDLPTASGKTACIEMAVFRLALAAGDDWRNTPRRIFFVVDRRVIVDQAFRRARSLADALARAVRDDSSDQVVRAVAQRLTTLAGPESLPLGVARLRGGIRRDSSWTGSPAQPAVIAATVDQVGSRLLFRSYDGRPYSYPVHAALVGNDSLILLDEAHCAQPFLETARAVRSYRGSNWTETRVGGSFGVVSLSATPGAGSEGRETFRLTEEERHEPELSRRLHTPKPTRLSVAGKAKVPRGGGLAEEQTARERLADYLTERVLAVFEERRPARTAVMVNRVATAVAVRSRLLEALSDSCDVLLMTGRMRPLDRDDLLAEWEERLAAGAERPELERPVVVVATQTLEVGADFDFDALITEAASLDALRQRFGRLNRLGASHSSFGEVVVAEYQRKDSVDDPVYGSALSASWNWLLEMAEGGESAEEVDFSDGALGERWRSDPRPELLAPSSKAPVLFPAHLDRLVQTDPIPVPSPEPSFFLHGPEPRRAEVSVLWRADLAFPQPDQEHTEGEAQTTRDRILETLTACPPSSVESLSVSLAWLRRWLEGGNEVPVQESDVEGRGSAEESLRRSAVGRINMLVWRGSEDSIWTSDPKNLRPGDMVILSAKDQLGSFRPYLQPMTKDLVVLDLGDRAQAEARGRAVLRLHPEVISAWPEVLVSRSLKQALIDYATMLAEEVAADEMQGLLRDVQSNLPPEASIPVRYRWLRVAVDGLLKHGFKIHPYPSATTEAPGLVLRGPAGSAEPVDLSGHGTFRSRLSHIFDEDAGTASDETSEAPAEILLPPHGSRVGKLARELITACPVPASLIEDVGVAADCHDIGKADPRFQAVLRGDGIAVAMEPLLAKSDELPTTYWQSRWLKKRAGIPPGFRHELVSVRLVESDPELLARSFDPDLVLHLIAAHHGRCRPFAPVVPDDEPVTVVYAHREKGMETTSATGLERLDSGSANRFWRLVRRYGWWGLAYLETILVSADHLVSAMEREQPELQRRSGSAEVVA